MYTPVCLYIRLPTKRFITHIAGIRTLANMSNLMCLHIRLLTEGFSAHITGIRTLASMYKLVSLPVTL